MKKNILVSIFAFVFQALAFGQQAKVDINMEGRKEAEVNETGYTPWFVARVNTASITVNGVTFQLVATGPTPFSTFRCGWSKLLVQAPYLMRLVEDGAKVDNDSLLAHPGVGASFELRISGLGVGKHSLQTFHNNWEDTTLYTYSPLNVYLNGVLVHERINRSTKATSVANATRLTTEMEVTAPGQEMVLRFEADTLFTPSPGKKKEYNMGINAFELNTDDASKLSYEPIPTHRNFHVNTDSGYVTLQWKPASNRLTKTHTLYFGTDSTKVANGGIGDEVCKATLPLGNPYYVVDQLYSMNRYYWRVDQTDSSGVTTKGRVWNFQPRQLAFRGAEGYGRYAAGGRGGKVVYVTNLNDNGPGSFREAVTSDIGPRTVLFNVSGRIILNGTIFCKDHVTIAGQSAPGKGICFSSSPIGVGTESVCRYVRTRIGSGETADGMGMAGSADAIMDHCSISWSIDEGFSSRSAKNITMQRCMISEALNIANHDHYVEGSTHGFAAVVGGDVGSFHHNLIAHCHGRNPRLDGGIDGANHYAGRVDIFNNVVYNWSGSSAYGEAHEANFHKNYYRQGPATDIGKTICFVADVNQRLTNLGTESYYVDGNVIELKTGGYACNGSTFDCGIKPFIHGTMTIDWTILVNKPYFPSYAKVESAYDAYKSVLSDVGCNMPVLDDHDKRIVQETKTRTAKYIGRYSQMSGIIDHEDDAGGFENYGNESRPAGFDTDLDGLPDWWEELHGTNKASAANDFSDANADPDKDGFTALEDYLEWMAVPHTFSPNGETVGIDLALRSEGYEKSPTFKVVTTDEGLSCSLNGKVLSLTPSAGTKGIRYCEISITDQEGASMNRVIGVCAGVNDVASGIVTKATYDSEERAYVTGFDQDLTIELKDAKERNIRLSLEDLSGRVLQTGRFHISVGRNTVKLSGTSALPAQMYLVRLTNEADDTAIKVMKAVKN